VPAGHQSVHGEGRIGGHSIARRLSAISMASQ
jgi:hypothetical protein